MALILNRQEFKRIVRNGGLRVSAEAFMGLERITMKLVETAIVNAKERRDKTLKMIHFLPSKKV